MSVFNSQIVPTPISIPHNVFLNPSSQAATSAAGNGVTTGADLLTHLEFNIRAGINLEWCSNTILQFSKNAPWIINKVPWVLEYLLSDLSANLSAASALSLRNLSQDTEFTQLLALHPRSKKILYDVVSNFEDEDDTDTEDRLSNELLFHTIDIIESVSSYYAPGSKDDPLFLSLTKLFTLYNDRSLLISIMRSFARYLVRSEPGVESCVGNLSSEILDKIVSFLLTEDHDLLLAALDFLYQYSLPGNARIVTLLRSSTRLEILRTRLPHLLTFNLNITNNPNDLQNLKLLKLVKRTKPPVPETAPKLSPEHFKVISQLSEPLRATAWMRCCYRSAVEGEVTQISLWKSYEQQFEHEAQVNKRKLLPAVDFIKNVSQAFQNSNAMVINLPNGQRKFIIKGIEPREFSVDIKTGDFEVRVPPKNSYDSDLPRVSASQEPLPVYTPPSEINDVNKSSALLLTSLVNHNQTKELVFKPMEEEIFKKTEAVPQLFDILVDFFETSTSIESKMKSIVIKIQSLSYVSLYHGVIKEGDAVG